MNKRLQLICALAGTAAAAVFAILVLRSILIGTSQRLLDRRSAVDHRLSELAELVPAAGTGPSGCLFTESGPGMMWIDLRWPQPMMIQELVLIPVVHLDPATGVIVGDGFPQRLEILLGESPAVPIRQLSFTETEANWPSPHIVDFSDAPLQTRHLRIQTRSFSPRNFDGRSVVQLAEILAFDQMGLNHAPSAAITCSGDLATEGFSIGYAVDGILPYDMDGPGEGSAAYMRFLKVGEPCIIEIELPEAAAADTVVLYPKDRSYAVPWRYLPGEDFPSALRVESANQPDFSDAWPLLDTALPFMSASVPMALPLDAGLTKTFRYVRLQLEGRPHGNGPQLGCSLAEFQLMCRGRNLLTDARILSASPVHGESSRLRSLIDGRNRGGQILDLQEWLHQLSTRQQLTMERAAITGKLAQAEQRRLQLLHWSVIFVVLSGASLWLLHLLRVTRIRAAALEAQELLLAELHDEVGASLHAVRMFAEIGLESAPEKRIAILENIRRHAGDGAECVRRMTRLMDEGITFEALRQELATPCKWLPANCRFNFSFVDNPALHQSIPPQAPGHLLRFFHECLANITRHAHGVSIVNIHLEVAATGLSLMVADDGCGLTDIKRIPPSLLRRAKLARGRISVWPADAGSGLRVQLVIPLRRRW